MPNLDEACGQPPRPCSGQALPMGSPSGLILEKPAKKDSEMVHERAQAHKNPELKVSTGQDGKLSVLPYLWTDPESISSSRRILSTVETAEGKGVTKPLV